MQKVFILVLAVATVGLAAFSAMQSKQLQAARDKAAAAERALVAEQQTRESQEALLREAQAARTRLAEQVQQFTQVTTTLREKDAKQSSNLTAMAQMVKGANGQGGGASAKGGAFGKDMGNMLQTMMKDPAMRDMLRSQQKVAINQMYKGLFKDLNLAPDAREKLAGILTDSQMRNLEAAQGMMGEGGQEQANMKEMQAKMDAAKKQTEADVKALLGDEGYAKYDNYQKTIGERMQLESLTTNLQEANLPLQEGQSAQLLQILQEEKAAVPPVIPTDNTQTPANMKELMTPAKIAQQLQWMKDYDDRIANRARGILNAEQFAKFADHQKQQRTMQEFGLKLASEMLGDSPAAPKP